MYKIIIVDDEVWVRRGLLKQIEWEKLNASLAGEAADGEEGYELALAVKPHIVITDVKMPGSDGIELMERIQSSLPNTRVVVISGYSEFELVQKALINKAVNYILKPINETDLNRSISMAIEEIQVHAAKDKLANRLQITVNQSLPALREKQLNLALTQSAYNPKVFLPYLEEIRRGDEGFVYRIAVVHMINFNEVLERRFKADAVSLQFSIDNIVQTSGNGAPRYLSFKHSRNEDEHLLLIGSQTNEIDECCPHRETTELLLRISDNLASYLGLHARIGTGRSYSGYDNLRCSYDEAVHALQALSLDNRSNTSFKNLIFYEEIREKVRETRHDPLRQIIEYIRQRYCEPLTLDSIAGQFHFNPSYLSRAFKTETGENFSDYVVRLRMEQAVRLMRNPGLKLYEIAEMVGYENKNYFSKAFKKAMNESPSKYREGLLS